MMNRDSLYDALEEARIRAAPRRMTAEEIRCRSERLNNDILHFERLQIRSHISQELIISECVVGCDLLDLYTENIPLSGPEPIRFFRTEYMSRLGILENVLNDLIGRVTISLSPGNAIRRRR